MMAAYEWQAGSCINNVSAQVVGEICEELEKSAGGLSPQALLDVSRNENAPLHNAFEWDNTIAAEKWRLEQARNLIKNIRIIRTDNVSEREEMKVRGFVSTPGRKSIYVSMDTALHHEKYRNYLLEQARKDCEIFQAKYRKVEELSSVIEAMEGFLETKVS